jgi:hypothetical protein
VRFKSVMSERMIQHASKNEMAREPRFSGMVRFATAGPGAKGRNVLLSSLCPSFG